VAPSGQLRVGRYIGVLLAILVAIYALVFFTGTGSLQDKLTPRLGLDLEGGTTVTLIARTPSGQAPSKASLETARQILEDRVNGLGVGEPEVVTEGNSNIVVNVPGKSADAVKRIGQPAELRFRQVIKSTADTSAAAANASPSPSASPSGSPSASPSPSAKASAKAGAVPAKKATPAASPLASASPLPSASPSPQAVTEDRPALSTVTAKIPNYAAVVAAVQKAQGDPAAVQQDQSIASSLPAFSALTGAEVGVLPADIQYAVPTISCKLLGERPAGSVSLRDQQVTACDKQQKYFLDKSTVDGRDVKSADFSFDTQGGQGWTVDLTFTGGGQDKWTNLTKLAFNSNTDQNAPSRHVAIVLDNVVVSAPTILNVIPGNAQITGQFSQTDAQDLANKLKYGSLPLSFNQAQSEELSPTLGSAQLVAGLVAGAIGLAAVILYVMFYYRVLGLVTIASLVASGLTVYGMLLVLGRPNTLGFTLTLSGIAGFIVAIGITADSFVVFFERLKDEIREGRSPRSAVPRAWIRARRTILSADTVSLLAAVLLYFFAIGAVKGFAFTLGMSTVIDLLIVFLFTHPLVALMSRSKTFMSPRISGLGRVDHEASPVPARTPVTKEA
jgi:preprotein translocase subunit SecD